MTGLTTQETSGTWHRVPGTGRQEWRIDSNWAEDAPEGWVVTRLENRTHLVHEWEWHNYTELTLETAAGARVEVIVDENNYVWTPDGESLSYRRYGHDGVDAIERVAQAFRVEVGG